MKILLTTTTKPLSKLITWGLSEPASHIVFLFQNRFVVHSYLTGVRIDWFESFRRDNIIVSGIDITMDGSLENEVMYRIMNNQGQKGYDYNALLYWVYRGFLFKFFKIPFPTENAWDDENSYLCTEMVRFLPDTIRPEVDDYEILSPYKLYQRIKNKCEMEGRLRYEFDKTIEQ